MKTILHARAATAFALFALPLCGLLLATAASARPVSYADGHMFMADYQPDMQQASYTYSPSFRWSASVGQLRVDDLDGAAESRLDYVRSARLLRRWNGPASQGNAFGWVGVGHRRFDTASGRDSGTAWHTGFQLDWETRRVYTALTSEWHGGAGPDFRLDTASLGWAPYKHDHDRMATWFVVKGMRTEGAIDEDVMPVGMLRFFTARWWVEIGATADGEPIANLMLNL